MTLLHQPELPFDDPVQLFPQGRAFTIFGWLGKRGRLDRQYPVEVDDVQTVRPLLRGQPDIYETQWFMDRPKARNAFALAGTNAYGDLDSYKVPKLADLPPDAVAECLLRYCDEIGLPRPSAIVGSGRGLTPRWCFSEVVGRDHVGKMIELNRALTRKLAEFGADAHATNAARFLRVVGSVHSRAHRMVEVLHLEQRDGRTITYDPHWLLGQLVPRADDPLDAILTPAPDRAREARRDFRNAPHRFTRESWFWAIVEDIRTLAALRWPRRPIPEGWRDTFAFLTACQMLRIFPPQEARAETLAVVSTMIEPDFLRRYLDGLCSTAMRYASEAWAARNWVKTYRYGKTSLIRELGITQAEMRHMRALIDEAEYLRRHSARERQRRRDAGAMDRGAYEARSAARGAEAVAMRARGMTLRAIGAELGISAEGVRWLLARAGAA